MFMNRDERDKLIRFPRNTDDLRSIHQVISKYSEDNKIYVLFAFCYLYIFLQSFAIPGPVFLSILSGALFGAIPGFLLVCFVKLYYLLINYLINHIITILKYIFT